MLRRVIRALRRAYHEDSEIKEASWDRVGPRQDGDCVAQAEVATMSHEQRVDDRVDEARDRQTDI
jgi:hypothetical protein